jgi:hypothetical protein
MRSYGLNSTRATGTADAWFKAFAAAPSPAEFHNQGKTPFGLSSPRDMGKLLEKIAPMKSCLRTKKQTTRVLYQVNTIDQNHSERTITRRQ